MAEPFEELTTDIAKQDDLRKHLIENYIKTEDEVNQMTDDQVRKVYLNYNKKVIDDMSGGFIGLLAETYVTAVDKLVPRFNKEVVNKESLTKKLSEDMFVKAALNRFFPPFYYNYGSILAPFSVMLKTTAHIENKKDYILENGEEYQNIKKERRASIG